MSKTSSVALSAYYIHEPEGISENKNNSLTTENKKITDEAPKTNISPNTGTILPFPNFKDMSEQEKQAGRYVASLSTPEEHQALESERRMLVIKQFKEGITRKETCRLKMIEWELDRIEDSQYGQDLDRLETLAHYYKRLGNEISNILERIEQEKVK